MGCSTSKLESNAAPRKRRRPSKLDAVKEQQAAALDLEIERWMAADKECRTLCCTTAPDPRESSQKPAFDDDAAGRLVQFAVDSIRVVVMPTAEEMGPNLSREVYWTRAEFDTMMRERKLLAIKAARFMRRHPDKVLDKKTGEPVPVVAGESRRGLGIGPYEQAILGNRKARDGLCGNQMFVLNRRVDLHAIDATPARWRGDVGDDRIRRYNNRIFELHRAASSVVDEDWDPSNPSLQSACEASPARCGDEYSFVAASANDLDSSVYRISKQNAEAAHKIAEAEHKQLVASLTSAERDKREHYKRRAARLAKSPAHARRKSQPKTRKDEKIFPDGQDSVNVAGLGAEEHLAAIHADQFHRLLRADSFDDFQDM